MSNGIILTGSILGNPNISTEKIKEIKSAKNINEVECFWDKIKDFFCGTHRVEAKKHLFTLYNENASEMDKLQAFESLRQLAAPACKNIFQKETLKNDGVRITIHSNDVSTPPIYREELSSEILPLAAFNTILDIKKMLDNETKAFFEPLLDILEISNPTITSPIVGGDGDGSTARSILLGIQSGKISITDKGKESLVTLMQSESDIIFYYQCDIYTGFKEFQGNKELQRLHAKLEKELTFSKGFRPLIFMGDVAHDRFSCNKDVDSRIRDKLHENGAILIFGNHDSCSHVNSIIKKTAEDEYKHERCFIQFGKYAKDSKSEDEWIVHEDEVFDNAYYDNNNRTLYIHNGLALSLDEEHVLSGFDINGMDCPLNADELVKSLNKLPKRGGKTRDMTSFRPPLDDLVSVANKYNIRIVRGHEGNFNVEKKDCISINARKEECVSSHGTGIYPAAIILGDRG